MVGKVHISNKISPKDLCPEMNRLALQTQLMSFSITRRCSLRLSSKKKFPMIQSLCIVLRNFHAVEARNQGPEYAASDGTMFTLCT